MDYSNLTISTDDSNVRVIPAASRSQIFSSIIPCLIIFACFMAIFVSARKRHVRVYEPRKFDHGVPSDLQPDESPPGCLAWFTSLLDMPRAYWIQHAGPDGYFFLRFMVMFTVICLFGWVLTWPILLPINGTGGYKSRQAEALSFGNVKDNRKYYAHAFISWFFFGGVIFVIYRELVYYTTFRHALQTTPKYHSMLSSRTLLLTDIPEQALGSVSQSFPAAKHISFVSDYSELDKKITERNKLVDKYEQCANTYIVESNKLRIKYEKKTQSFGDLLDSRAKRPTHKTKNGDVVDTLDYSLERLSQLNKEIAATQETKFTNKKFSSVFIEFPTQIELQKAFQALPHHKQLKKAGRFTGIAPEDVLWKNLCSTKGSRRVRKFLASVFMIGLILIWLLVMLIIGAYSNISAVVEFPQSLVGVLTTFLPAVAMALILSFVPRLVQKVGAFSHRVTKQQQETFCQNWLFAFQTVNTYFVITVASTIVSIFGTFSQSVYSITATVGRAMPRASNFYISYLCFYGLVVSSGTLLQFVSAVLPKLGKRKAGKTPRATWNRSNLLKQPVFSTLYPVNLILALIVICYSIVTPLILVFALITFFLLFAAYLYTLLHVQRPNSTDSRGRQYPLALFQLFVALYFAEVMMLALFILVENWASASLEGAFLLFTAASHIYFKRKFLPLFEAVPLSALKNAAGDASKQYPMHDQGLKEIKTDGQNYWNGGSQGGIFTDVGSTIENSVNTGDEIASGRLRSGSDLENVSFNPQRPQKENSIGRVIKSFIFPKSETFDTVRDSLPESYFKYKQYNEDFLKIAYNNPALHDEAPHLWIVRDSMGLSEVEKSKALGYGVDMSDANTGLNEKSCIECFGPPSSYDDPFEEEFVVEKGDIEREIL